MSSLEKKLAEYREKNRETPKRNYRNNLLNFFTKNDQKELKEKVIGDHVDNTTEEDLNDIDGELNFDTNSSCCSYMDIVFYTLCFILWATCWAIFIKFQFGIVYFVMSLLIGVCVNTRTRPKHKGEVSAYSVFNENCESIDGTLKAEQFEKEIRYGQL